MKIKISLLFLLSFFALKLSSQVSFGSPVKINNDWRFTLSDPQHAEKPGYDDKKWQNVTLPHDWSVRQQFSSTYASCMGYLPGGIGWYRKTMEFSPENKEKKVYLYFEGIYNRSEVFVNGQSVGKRPNGYISFSYDITPYVEFGLTNNIAVRVDHSQSADSRWYTGSGIYRDVWIIYANPLHITQWGLHAYPKNLSAKEATLDITVEVENNLNTTNTVIINNELISPGGEIIAKNANKTTIPAGKITSIKSELHVKNPSLWDIDNPMLYQLKTTVVQNGKTIDQTITKTGFRTYTFDPDKGFALNGRWMKMKGVCLHHDAGVLGSAVPREVWKRRLMALKKIGCNAIRTSHNPQAPDLYDLCDELGLLVMNEAFDEWEFPKRKWIEGWNKGTPGFQGSFDFFEEWGEQDLADMVRRDRNHISIFAWSIGNEVDYPNDPYSHPILDGGPNTGFTQPIFGGYKKDAPDAMRLGVLAKRLTSVVRMHDTSRAVTAGLAGVAMSNESEYPDALDIAGYNYTESRYQTDHAKYPTRVIYGSENRHDLKAWHTVRDNQHIFGQFLWTGIDYLGESGVWPSRGFYSGLLDFGGFIKPRGYFRQSLWSEKPMAYIGTYPTLNNKGDSDVWSTLESQNKNKKNQNLLSVDAWPLWNYAEGQEIRVVCYTNAPQAQLLLNGNIIGKSKPYDDKTGIIFWDIPYQPGKLEVNGLDKNGKLISKYEIQSSGAPHSIVVEKTLIDKKSGLIQIVTQLVDENGKNVLLSDNEITCTITGPAKLLGLEASNNADMSDYTDNKHRVFNGRLLTYIQAEKNEEIRINFSSPWLREAEVQIHMDK